VADVRAAVAWIRANAEAYGGNPNTILLAGGSSGADLAATTALSGTEVSGVIGFYGYYRNTDRLDLEPTLPQADLKAAAPPFLIVHGAQDTLVLSEDARKFADRLRAVSSQPVAYAELPGTQHNFDFFHSLRVHAVTDAVVRFAEFSLTPTLSTAQSGSARRRARRSDTPVRGA
jgi:acetyl esterase/lipase